MSHHRNPASAAKVKEVIAELDLVALVASSPENFSYVTGAHVPTARLLPTRHDFAVTKADGTEFVVVINLERRLLSSETDITDIRTYVEFKDDTGTFFANELKKEGLVSGRIGLDLQHLPFATVEEIQNVLPQVQLVDTTLALGKHRSHKSDAEIEILENATKSTHQAVLDAMASASLGETEKVMSDRIATNMIRYGADGTSFMCFGSGMYSNLFHASAFDWVTPEAGDIIRFDVGGKYGPWSSDFARTYSAGDPTEAQKQVYAGLVDIQSATIDIIEPGISCEDVYFFCRDQFGSKGLEFYMPHVGHSFGLELHENPLLRPGEKTKLAPGMVFNIEPSTFDDNKVAFHTEDLLVVTETGCRLMTLGLAPRELPIIGQTLNYRDGAFIGIES